jgi:hypothetical protein
MAKKSTAGPGEGVENPKEINEQLVENFGYQVLYIGWSGNGYKEDDTWITVHKDAACDLDCWL